MTGIVAVVVVEPVIRLLEKGGKDGNLKRKKKKDRGR